MGYWSTPAPSPEITPTMYDPVFYSVYSQYRDQVSAARGAELYVDKGCIACHRVKEDGPGGEIGPFLGQIGDPEKHPTLGGFIPNTPDSIWYYIQFPQKIDPGSEMAPSRLTGKQAADIVAFLLTLK